MRSIATTQESPIPLFIATGSIDPDLVRKLQDAFAAAMAAEELQSLRDTLLLADFVVPQREPYEILKARAQSANAYPDAW